MANDHMDYIEGVAREDIAALREKERTYRGSWKKRGGVGAFMMLCRKWDRLENMLAEASHTLNQHQVRQYDVFSHIEAQPGGEDGTVLAEVRDLRRYLLLVEAEMAARGRLPAVSPVEVEEHPPLRRGKAAERLDLWTTPQLRIELQNLGRSPAAPVGDALMHSIRAELERRENRPGSADDGGHHARYRVEVPE